MRVLRSYSIEADLVEKLEGSDNKSLLINNLLREHFDKEDIMGMNAEELKVSIKQDEIMAQAEKDCREVQKHGIKQI